MTRGPRPLSSDVIAGLALGITLTFALACERSAPEDTPAKATSNERPLLPQKWCVSPEGADPTTAGLSIVGEYGCLAYGTQTVSPATCSVRTLSPSHLHVDVTPAQVTSPHRGPDAAVPAGCGSVPSVVCTTPPVTSSTVRIDLPAGQLELALPMTTATPQERCVPRPPRPAPPPSVPGY